MPDLDPVTQRFEADTAGYTEAVLAAAAAARALARDAAKAATAVAALRAAIDGLEDRTVRIGVEVTGLPGGALTGNLVRDAQAAAEAFNEVARAEAGSGAAAEVAAPEIRRVGQAWLEAANAGLAARDSLNDQRNAMLLLADGTPHLQAAFRQLTVDELANARAGLAARDALRAQAEGASLLSASARQAAIAAVDWGELSEKEFAAAKAAVAAALAIGEVNGPLVRTGMNMEAFTRLLGQAVLFAEQLNPDNRTLAGSIADLGRQAAIAAVDWGGLTEEEYAAARAAMAATLAIGEESGAAARAGVDADRFARALDTAVAGARMMPGVFNEGEAALTRMAAGFAAAEGAVGRFWDQFAATAGSAIATGGNGLFRLNADIKLWAGMFGDTALIGSVKAWHILLDGLIDAVIGLGGALIALAAGIYAMSPAFKDIYTHMHSVWQVSTAMGVTIPPLTGWFESLQHAVAPQAVEAFGGGLALIGRNAGSLTPVIKQVVTGIDDWIARLDLFMAHQNSMAGVLRAGAGYLSQFRVIIDEIGKALANLVKDDPGTVHFLLDFLEGAAKVLDVITSLPTPIVEAALALHSFMLWGGLAASMLGRLLVGVGNLITNLVKFAAILPSLAANPFTWFAVAAAGIAVMAYEMNQASQSAKDLIANMNSGLDQLKASDAINQINADIGNLNTQIPTAMNNSVKAIDPFNKALREGGKGVEGLAHDMGTLVGFGRSSTGVFGNLGKVFTGLGKAAADFVPDWIGSSQSANNVKAFSGEIVSLTKDQDNLFRATGALVRQGYTYAQAMGIMDLAGVRAGDSLAIMDQKIANLINGYQAMSVRGGLLANGINAVTFASEQQNSQINALTQGWTAFITLVTGGESAMVSFAQQIQGVAAAAGGAATTLNISSGKVSLSTKDATASANAAAVSMTGLSAASLQLRGSFGQAITQGSALMNSLMEMASAAGLGAAGTKLLTQAGQLMVQQLAPMTQGSAAATAQLYALAQQAGYHGADSLKALAQWAGNTKDPMTALDAITTKLTVDSADLATDVQHLAEALNTNLDQAMASAIFQASGGQHAFDNFANAILHTTTTSRQMHDAAQALATQLVTTLGDTRQAHNEFDSFAVQLGLTKKQADALWDSLNHLPRKIAETVTVSGTGRWSVTGGPTLGTRGGSYAAAGGWRVPGYGGGDSVPAMLEPGEAVVPKHLVSHVAPFLSASKVPGFAAGGVAGYGPGNLPGLGNWVTTQMSQTTQDIAAAVAGAVNTQQQQLTAAYASSAGAANAGAAANQRLGQRMAAAYGWGTGIQWYDLVALWNRESGWSSTARNPTSSASGIAQNIAGWSAGYQPGNAAQQIAWGLAYIRGRYGTPMGAMAHEQTFGWYDQGGYLPPGLSLAFNGTGRPEPVTPAGAIGGPVHIHIEIGGKQVAEAVLPSLVGAAGRYSLRNSGRVTGQLRPS